VTSALGEVLPVAVATLVASLPVVAVVLVIVTKPGAADLGFLAGWAAGLAAVGGIVILIVDTTAPAGESSRWAAVLRTVFGAVLLVLAVRRWMSRPRAGEVAAPPGWAKAVEAITAARALGFGFLLGGVNPKNMAFAAAAAAAILGETTVPGEQVVALAVFVVVASLGVATPILVARVGGTRGRAALERVASRTAEHDAVVTSVVLLVLGAVLVVSGVTGLVR
jgi:hypothetical protein